MIAKIDLQGRFISANEGFLEARGFAGPDLIGQPYDMLSHREMPESVYAQVWRKLRRGDDVFAYLATRAKNGDLVWEMAYLAPSHDAEGTVDGYRVAHRRADPEEIAQIEPFYRKIRKLENDAPGPKTQRETDDTIALAA